MLVGSRSSVHDHAPGSGRARGGADSGRVPRKAAAQIRQRLGLDRRSRCSISAGRGPSAAISTLVQTGDPVAALILDRLGPTLPAHAGALALALVVAVPLACSRRPSRHDLDTLGSAVALFGVSFRASGWASC